MSAEVVYLQNQLSANHSSMQPDRGVFINGMRPSHHGGHSPQIIAVNTYQQQLQAAVYQQQQHQLEIAQQHAQMEMHMQLEQMRLQNLALQEQIMFGQAQAQAQAESHQLRTMYQGIPVHHAQTGRLNFSGLNPAHGNGLAERALARRQHAQQASQVNYGHNGGLIYPQDGQVRHPPALVLSEPGDVYPVINSPRDYTKRFAPNTTTSRYDRTGSSASTSSTGSSLTDVASSGLETPASEVPGSSRLSVHGSVKAENENTPKLNPFSSVFVPTSAGPVTSESAGIVSPSVYRAPRSKSPPNSRQNQPSRLQLITVPVVLGAIPIRQPRGPAAEAELTNQNFASRIRKRAIKSLVVRNPCSPVSGTYINSNGQHIQALGGIVNGNETNHIYNTGMLSPSLAALYASQRGMR